MFKMSFWQKNTQPDLSVTGRSTSRHQRPPSGHRGRPHSAGRGGSTKSHIFGITDTPRQDEPKQKPASGFQGNNASVTSSSLHTTPEAPRPSSGHAPKKAAGSVSNVRSILNKYFNNHYYSTIKHKYNASNTIQYFVSYAQQIFNNIILQNCAELFSILPDA